MFSLPKNNWIKLTLIAVSFLVVSTFAAPVMASGVDDYREDCSTTSVNPDCKPPRLKDAQLLVVKVITVAWSMGAVLFFFLLLFNGAVYLLGSWEESKYILGASIEDVQKRMAQWGIGFFMFFLSYPMMNTLLQGLVADTSCYEDLRQPGFTFFFPTICTEPDFPAPGGDPNVPITTTPGYTNFTCNEYRSRYPNNPSPIATCITSCGIQYNDLRVFPISGTSHYVYCYCSDKSCAGVTLSPP